MSLCCVVILDQYPSLGLWYIVQPDAIQSVLECVLWWYPPIPYPEHTNKRTEH